MYFVTNRFSSLVHIELEQKMHLGTQLEVHLDSDKKVMKIYTGAMTVPRQHKPNTRWTILCALSTQSNHTCKDHRQSCSFVKPYARHTCKGFLGSKCGRYERGRSGGKEVGTKRFGAPEDRWSVIIGNEVRPRPNAEKRAQKKRYMVQYDGEMKTEMVGMAQGATALRSVIALKCEKRQAYCCDGKATCSRDRTKQYYTMKNGKHAKSGVRWEEHVSTTMKHRKRHLRAKRGNMKGMLKTEDGRKCMTNHISLKRI